MDELMQKPKCNVCGKVATVLDTEYDEYYCRKDAEVYDVFDGPYRELGDEDVVDTTVEGN